MKWSWKITRIAGIDVHIHATFFILLLWLGLSYWLVDGSLGSVISGVGFVLALFACVVLHELGHALTARRYGIRTRQITLLPAVIIIASQQDLAFLAKQFHGPSVSACILNPARRNVRGQGVHGQNSREKGNNKDSIN